MQYIILQLLYLYQNLKNPKLYRVNNYYKSKIFINNCIKNNVKYFIFSSTAAVYENPKKILKLKKILKEIQKIPTVYLNYLLRITYRVYKQVRNFVF